MNSLTFRNVPDGERDFPTIRVLGTIGWIFAGLLIDQLFHGKTADAAGQMVPNTIATNGPLMQAAILSAILGVFSFLFLPKTPPTETGAELSIFLRAVSMLKDFNYAVFFVVTLIASIAMGIYFNSTSDFLSKGAGVSNVGSTMAIGQGVELLLLVLLPLFLKKFGIKTVLTIGLACWPFAICSSRTAVPEDCPSPWRFWEWHCMDSVSISSLPPALSMRTTRPLRIYEPARKHCSAAGLWARNVARDSLEWFLSRSEQDHRWIGKRCDRLVWILDCSKRRTVCCARRVHGAL